MEDKKKINKKTLTGIVVSDKGDKTVIVEVSQFTKNAKYGKFIKRSKRYAAHDEKNARKVGEKVSIRESRPISKRKHFVVVK